MKHQRIMRTIGICLIAVFLLSLIPSLAFPVEKQGSSDTSTIWENPFTQKTFHSDNLVNSTSYTFPKVIWNGSQFVDYLYNSSEMSGGIGSVYVRVMPDHTTFYDPYRSEERIGQENWIVQYYNQSSLAWITDNQTDVSLFTTKNSSGIYFARITMLNSGSRLEEWYCLKIGSRMKITLILDSALSTEYKLSWSLNQVAGNTARWLTNIENITSQTISDPLCSQILFGNENESESLVDWSDTNYIDQNTGERRTYLNEVRLEKTFNENLCQATITFGDFILTPENCLVLDPSIQTLNSNKALDGYIERYGPTYPPQQGANVNTSSNFTVVGVEGKDYGGQNYHQCRTYLSFDTSTIPALSHDISSTLKIKTYDFDSNENFTVKVWGGNQTVFQNNLTITDGTQPIYGSNLVTSSWGSGRVQVATWDTSDYQAGIYVNLSISSNQINKTGSTQFELNSTVEGSTPGPIAKYVWFYSDDCQGNEPKLEVTYSLDTLTMPDGETLFIRSNSTNKAVIILFGADNLSDNYLSIKSIDFPGDGFDTYAEKNQGKLFFLDALIENGFSVFTPSHDASSGIYRTYYEGCSNWVQDLSIWLQENQSYSQIFIFGFSGGGVVVGNEIQKDYASRFSAAVMNCAPVNWSSYTGQMWHTAAISSNAKVATCFPENIEDLLDMTPTFYEQMKSYYDNVAVDKEWHNWTGGHGQFFDANYTCLWHNATYSTGENNSGCVLSWFNAVHHSPSYMRSDTQSVNRLSAYKLSIPQSASSAVNIQSGSGAGATWGIRAWIRHSNGVEQEIGLDGQTGTPQATVEGGSAGIRSSTVSVAQTTLQSTDSLVIRVYLSIGEGSWNLCATFTTEQLQSSTLKATTWTVYYYTWSQYYRQIDRTTAKFYWGTTTYNSRIQNIQLS